MATTFVDYTGDGNATKAFSFPSYKVEDIKVDVDGVIKTVSTHYNITSYTTTGGGNVVFTSGNIPASPAAIRIFRDTDVDSAKATFTAGSSVKAGDLNNNNTQLLYAAQEEQNQTILASDIKDGAITTAKIVDSNITAAKLASDSVTTAKIADDAVTMAKLAGGTLPTDISVAGANITDLSVDTADIANDAVTADKLANSINTEIAANTSKTTNQTHTGDVTGSVALTIANDAVTTAKINNDAVTTAKIADAELKVLAGMQSGTASKLADSTALTADIADLNQIDGLAKQTTITDDDTKFPTSGAIVDYVAAQLEPFGGFEAIANEVSFPNTQPASGVAISIADAAGIAVSGSGSSTTGRTVGGSTVTINGINSQFNSTTVATGIRFIVTSTGSGQVYNYHKATLAESDLVSLSGDINDFAERYRVGSSNPTSSLDNGDLFFNTSTGKLLVYNGTNSAWEEAQSIGNFFISTLSPAFDGTTQDFTLTNAPTNAQQIILSINGVVQKPNAGSSAPSEGFALTGSTVKLSAAPATGSTYHAVVMGSTVNIGTPSNNTVTTAILQDNAVATAKIADDAVTAAKLANNAVVTASILDDNVTNAKLATNCVTNVELADQAVTLDKITHGTSSNNGKFLRANNGAYPSFETIDLTALSASNLTSGTVPDARFPATLPAASAANLTSIPAANITGTLPAISGANLTGVSSPEVYGFKTTGSELQVTTTNGGADNISGATFDTFEDVVLAATGFSFSVNANGKLIATI